MRKSFGERAAAVAKVHGGASKMAVAQEYGVSLTTIGNWLAKSSTGLHYRSKSSVMPKVAKAAPSWAKVDRLRLELRQALEELSASGAV